MPYLVKIGLTHRTQSRLSSKGYHIYRLDKVVIMEWGSIIVSNRRSKKFYWAGENLPQRKEHEYKSVEDAIRHYKEKLTRRSSHDYDLLPRGIQIHKWGVGLI